jgi:CRISPR-associated protein Csx14
MTAPAPDITVDINLRNPGQVFACCGLLELASRKWPATAASGWREPEGWFARDGGRATFNIATGSGSNDPLGKLVDALCEAGDLVSVAEDGNHYSEGLRPVVLRAPFDVRLDWWLENYRPNWDKTELKIWAGRQTPVGTFSALREALSLLVVSRRDKTVSPALLSTRLPMSGRFGFDAAVVPNALDVGFSTDLQQLPVETSPATEILAAIGLQRSRPVIDTTTNRRWFSFSAWAEPASIVVAPAALAGVGRSIGRFTFPVEMRNAQYGNFGWAKPVEG